MSFAPYIHFRGNCAEAMQAYANIVGATDLQIIRYADAPPSAGVPQGGGADKVMHSRLTAGGQTLMASDFPDHMAGAPQAAVSISHMVGYTAQGKAVFDYLAVGGEVVMPFGAILFQGLWYGQGPLWHTLDDYDARSLNQSTAH